jgi:sec-independent protein translocase protein TatA
MFGSIGMPELIVIFVIALLVFGPTKLPDLGKSLGEAIRGFKKAMSETEKTPLTSDETRTKTEDSAKS